MLREVDYIVARAAESDARVITRGQLVAIPLSRAIAARRGPGWSSHGGLDRPGILHHAAESAVYGLALIKELGRHGYSLSPGTLYPIFHSLEAAGLPAIGELEAAGLPAIGEVGEHLWS